MFLVFAAKRHILQDKILVACLVVSLCILVLSTEKLSLVLPTTLITILIFRTTLPRNITQNPQELHPWYVKLEWLYYPLEISH